MGKLPRVSAIEQAVAQLDETIRDLRRRRDELAALVPKRRMAPVRGSIVDPRTGEEIPYRRR